MLADAPQIFIELEQSGLGHTIRSLPWAYPSANILHITSLVVFAGAVAIMDARLLGAFSDTRPGAVIGPVRKLAIAALCVQVASGLVLFIAEASHLVMNWVFLTKVFLIAVGVANALMVYRLAAPVIANAAAGEKLPSAVRLSAAISIGVWVAVATLGRLIAYV